MASLKGKTYPVNLYIVRDSDGVIHWYDFDPHKLKKEDRANHEVQSVGDSIIEFCSGAADTINPVVVNIACAHIVRGETFNPSQPAVVRRQGGNNPKHFEDLSGAVVDVLEYQNQSPSFPFSGVVLDRYGNVIATRRFASDGKCEDGEADHTLVLMAGLPIFEKEIPGVDEGPDGDEN